MQSTARIGLYTIYAGSYISPECMKSPFGGFHGALPTQFGHAPIGTRKAANCCSIHAFQITMFDLGLSLDALAGNMVLQFFKNNFYGLSDHAPS